MIWWAYNVNVTSSIPSKIDSICGCTNSAEEKDSAGQKLDMETSRFS